MSARNVSSLPTRALVSLLDSVPEEQVREKLFKQVPERQGHPCRSGHRIISTCPPMGKGTEYVHPLPQIDCCQAVCAENEGEFAAVMNVVFEHMPDNILARTCGTLFAIRWEDMLKIGRRPASKRILDHLPGPLEHLFSGICLDKYIPFRV